jgi:hypothetical protein
MAHKGGQRYRAVVVKSEGKRLLGSYRHKWWDDVKIDGKVAGGMAGLDSSDSG